jgi:hypothetical protein
MQCGRSESLSDLENAFPVIPIVDMTPNVYCARPKRPALWTMALSTAADASFPVKLLLKKYHRGGMGRGKRIVLFTAPLPRLHRHKRKKPVCPLRCGHSPGKTVLFHCFLGASLVFLTSPKPGCAPREPSSGTWDSSKPGGSHAAAATRAVRTGAERSALCLRAAARRAGLQAIQTI